MGIQGHFKKSGVPPFLPKQGFYAKYRTAVFERFPLKNVSIDKKRSKKATKNRFSER